MKIKAKKGEKEFVFEVKLHFSNSPQELKMEPIEFYQRHAKIPEGKHIEMEIVKLPEHKNNTKLHIHTVKNQKFVCFTHQIPTKDKALLFFTVWCLGSTYTLLTGKDFADYLGICKNNSETFEEKLKEEFNIECISIEK